MVTSKGLQSLGAHSASAPDYRHDIDGLRAVAILLVVVYHVWVGRVSGGVDAFLMISAFFLTGSFVRRLEEERPLRIIRQWTRTFKRLLPPAAVVLLGTLLVGAFLLPDRRVPELFRETWASLLYSENWLLAFNATDYYADKATASPVQHFWSLSVQGQVFLLWPLLFLIVRFLSRRLNLGVRVSALLVFALIFVASFVYSVVTTDARQAFAYFDTGARLWEFAAGALLAVTLPWIQAPRWLRGPLGWVGILALISCGMILDVQGGFPGYLALWPVLSIVALIVAGTGDGVQPFVSRALTAKPLVALGRDAYALYLVHWPLLVFALLLKRGGTLTAAEGLAVIAISLVAARLLTWLVDDRLRYAPWANKNTGRGLMVIVLSLLLVAVPTFSLSWATQQQERALKAELALLDPEESHPGAEVLGAAYSPGGAFLAPPIPLAGELDAEWGGLPERCEDQFEIPFDGHGTVCTYLPGDDPELTVAVIGDSHAEQWLGPIEEIARNQNWLTYSFLKGGCALALPDEETADDPEFAAACNAWMGDLLLEISELDPDLVISVGTRSPVANQSEDVDFGENEQIPPGMEEALAALEQNGTPIVLLRDNPRFSFNAFECADALWDGDTGAPAAMGANPDCGVSRGRALASKNPAESLVRPGLAAVDMTDRLCKAGSCPALIGNVFVYLDDNHLTSTYARTLAPSLEPRLLKAMDQARSWE